MIDHVLALNSIVYMVVGLLLYLKPTIVTQFTYTGTFPMEAYATSCGWGATMIPLAIVCYVARNFASVTSKRLVCRAVFVGYTALAHGTYLMIKNSFFGPWKNMEVQFVMVIIMAVINLYAGFL